MPRGFVAEQDKRIFALLDHELKQLVETADVGSFDRAALASKAQNRQDVLALVVSKFKRAGVFVEIGAADGVSLSNTHMLETQFEWSGILVEPSRGFFQALSGSRKARIDTRCVSDKSGESVVFSERGVLSGIENTIQGRPPGDFFWSKKYSVDTVTLLDLLNEHEAPSEIDFLSIDTEGSEYKILKQFNFDQFRFNVIVCEHNFGDTRIPTLELLGAKGYVRVLSWCSAFDDWYVHRDCLKQLELQPDF